MMASADQRSLADMSNEELLSEAEKCRVGDLDTFADAGRKIERLAEIQIELIRRAAIKNG